MTSTTNAATTPDDVLMRARELRRQLSGGFREEAVKSLYAEAERVAFRKRLHCEAGDLRARRARERDDASGECRAHVLDPTGDGRRVTSGDERGVFIRRSPRIPRSPRRAARRTVRAPPSRRR